MHRRRALAVGLERAVRRAHRPRRGRTAAVPVDDHAVLLAEPALIELADRLRDRREPIPEERLEAVRAMLTDCASPLHCGDGEALRRWAREVLP